MDYDKWKSTAVSAIDKISASQINCISYEPDICCYDSKITTESVRNADISNRADIEFSAKNCDSNCVFTSNNSIVSISNTGEVRYSIATISPAQDTYSPIQDAYSRMSGYNGESVKADKQIRVDNNGWSFFIQRHKIKQVLI